jgi:putative MATE family efflux protein
MSAPTAAPPSAAERLRQRLLSGPILLTLLAMAWPTMVQMTMYSLVLLFETWFIGKLGVVALAGASLVSPVSFLMQAMAAGGMGGAVTATIAKAAGSGNRDKVRSLAAHAVLIAIACGFAFAVVLHLFGPAVYRLLGGEGAALDAALAYSNVLFIGAPLLWVVIVLAAVLRGLGVTKVQATFSVAGSLVLIPLSPALIFGVGPIPAMGMRGAALAVIVYYALITAMYVVYLRSAKSIIRLRRQDFVPAHANFAAILKLGGVSSLLAVQSHITALMITGLAGSFGTVVLAGFGAAIRLQQVVEPFIFSLGTATVVMVATCIGAGNAERARKAAMTTAFAATIFYGLIGVFVALFPTAWVPLFTNDAGVIAAGAVYQRTMGPVYWCYGLALVVYYCSQGIGRMRWSYAGSLLRLAIISVAGTTLLSALHGGPAVLYRIVAVAVLISCGVSTLGIVRNDWEKLVPARLKAAA